ncbi:RloB domain-containing protein [bacterium]|nr:RloB domain-containing protein [bacterium]
MSGHLKRGKYRRVINATTQRAVVCIATEGKTEYQYFDCLKQYIKANCHIKLVKPDKKSAPGYVVNRLKTYLKHQGDPRDWACWIVIDHDTRKASQIKDAKQALKTVPGAQMAITEPCFEYWLLLHQDTIRQHPTTTDSVHDALRKVFPDYNKTIPPAFFDNQLVNGIGHALHHASNRHHTTPPYTTVHKLITLMWPDVRRQVPSSDSITR